MTRRAFLQKYFVRFAVSLTLVALIVYTVYHVFSSSSQSLMTTPTRTVTDRQVLRTEAYLFRNEQVLTVSAPGLINNLATSGTKVGSGVALTEVWSNGAQEGALAGLQSTLDRLNRVIAILESAQLPPGATLSQAIAYRAEALGLELTVRQAIAKGDFGRISSLEDEMLTALMRYASLTGQSDALSKTLSDLKKEKQELLQGSCTTVLNTQQSGYFYDRSCVDGYETIFDVAKLASLTAESFAEMIAATPVPLTEGCAVGKMVYGYDWYMAIATESASPLFEEGRAYSFTFSDNRDRVLRMTCCRTVKGIAGEDIAVFTSDEIPGDFDFLRRQNVEITVGSSTGYYVPASALHEVSGVEGVYIFKDSTAYFRRVRVLYRGDGYVIVAQNDNGDEAYLSLFDILITSGKDLYDGRVYK